MLFALTGCYPSNVLDKVDDPAFMKFLMQFDANGDHEISKQEAMMVTKMNGTFRDDPKSIKGIEYFENLEEFNVDSSDAIDMNFSKNKKLNTIVVRFNESLTNLIVPDQLVSLHLTRVQALKSLHLKEMPLLEHMSIDCYRAYSDTPNPVFNEFTIEKAPNLKSLMIVGTNIKNLDVSKMPVLKWLTCNDNEVQVLDVSNNPQLESLRCRGVKKIIMKEGQLIQGVNVNPNYEYMDKDVTIEYTK